MTSIPSIEVAFDCQPGQSFVIHWFTLTHNFNIDGANPNDMWPIQVTSRKDLDAQWGSQATLTLGVRPYFLTLPPLPFLTPPVRLVDAVPVTSAPDAPRMILLTGDAIPLDEPVTSKITINNVFRADTGAQLVMVDPTIAGGPDDPGGRLPRPQREGSPPTGSTQYNFPTVPRCPMSCRSTSRRRVHSRRSVARC